MKFIKKPLLVLSAAAVLSLAACGNTDKTSGSNSDKKLTGDILIDGSSTVAPIMEAVSEEYTSSQPDVHASVGISGTGGGFEKFTKGETDLSNASRPIKDEEDAIAKQNKIDYIQLELAYDGLSVVVSKDNDFVDQLTVEQLNKMWSVDSKVKTWNDINPAWPKEEIKFFSPGTASGTYDYFNEAILEKAGERKDAQMSEDDNVLVTGVAGEKNAIGYFGHAYYEENKDKLKIVPIVNPESGKAVIPTEETIKDGTYAPLSREIFTYVNTKSLKRAEVMDYLKFANENVPTLAEEVGYVPLQDAKYEENLKKLEEASKK
ncbi:PstS family phosphate ABC transporter substrate-binding protein [Bacillus sp. EAC]|uniref:PstS family phosphate ABC transporter substrate-binding protein n=1 Tax=Bacillus sp. EAC TaxID=1978338 RepID=UPI000B43A285|nr:PstS family phosphate ABC transporter substrate-binding protein [Bacillus sp. EAC]